MKNDFVLCIRYAYFNVFEYAISQDHVLTMCRSQDSRGEMHILFKHTLMKDID